MNKDLTVGNPQTVLRKFCMPLFGSIIFQQLYNIADSLVAGKFINESLENLSGIVGHGKDFPPENISVFGAPYQEVKLMDGLFIACKSNTLIKNNIRFDQDFKFHFYDLDFCRQAEIKNLKIGTFDMPLIHQSLGNFYSEEWKTTMKKYFEKWGE